MKKLFVPVLAVTALMFAYSPIAIAGAPYESTMKLVQKIFYYHFPAWMALTVSVTVCTAASAVYLFRGSARADRIAAAAAEVTVVFGLFGLVSGSLWGRKAWGVWWQWDARLTSTLVMWLVFQDAGWMIASGVILGMVLAAASGRLIAAFLFGVDPLDPLTFGSVPAVILLTAFVAAAAPAWRASRINPAVAFRSDG